MKICDVCVIIPSLNPTEKLEQVVTGLVEAGFGDIIVVNDGSNEEHLAPFEKLGCLQECTVLTHPTNLGKGVALKTAYSFFEQTRLNKIGVITMDGDGQHLTQDVVKCAEALMQSSGDVVMGVRNFRNSNVPARNSIGNRFTAFALRLLFGIKLRDTQTGLRGIPARHIPLMLEIHGSRFEYETNMLIELKRRGIAFLEVDIETVYEEGSNAHSHFRPFLDSVIIFARIFKYAISSVLSFLVDISVFGLAIGLLGVLLGPWNILVCTAIARAVSSFLNFNLNRWLVFQRKSDYGSQLWRYYTLAVLQMLVSAGGLWLLALALKGMHAAGLLTALKILVDTALFFVSYFIQRNWVFKKRRHT